MSKPLSEATIKTYRSCFKRYEKESDGKDLFATKTFHDYTNKMLEKGKPASRVAMVLKRITWICENEKNQTIDVDAIMLPINKIKDGLKKPRKKKEEPKKEPTKVETKVEEKPVKKVAKKVTKKVAPKTTKKVAKKVTKKVAKKVTTKA